MVRKIKTLLLSLFRLLASGTEISVFLFFFFLVESTGEWTFGEGIENSISVAFQLQSKAEETKLYLKCLIEHLLFLFLFDHTLSFSIISDVYLDFMYFI